MDVSCALLLVHENNKKKENATLFVDVHEVHDHLFQKNGTVSE